MLAIGTQTYKIVESLVPYLGPLTTNGYAVKNSFTFAEQLESSFESNNLLCVETVTKDRVVKDSLSVSKLT